MKTGENVAGSSGLEESGGASSRRKQNKGFAKQQSFHKQRFFSSNLKNHGTSRNSIAIISESPPSNSVGYFFGSTPPDSHGLVLSDHFFILNIILTEVLLACNLEAVFFLAFECKNISYDRFQI